MSTIPPYPITDISWKDEIMVVTFKNGNKIKFIGVNELQYNQIVSSKNPKKELEKLRHEIPNI